MRKPDPLPNTFMIRDLETLRVVADPLRTQIVEALIGEPLTVKQVAERLGLAPGKLYYHMNLLEKHGLIRTAATRTVANMVEKLYRASASNLDVDPGLLSLSTDEGRENVNALLAATIDATREDIQRSIQARLIDLEQGVAPQPRMLILSREQSRLSEARAKQFHKRLRDLIREFDDAGSQASDDDQNFALMVAYYPSFYFRAEEKEVVPSPKKRSNRRQAR